MTISSAELKKYRFFSDLSEGARQTLSSMLREVRVPRGTNVLREDETAESFFFVKQGRLEVTKHAHDGQEAKISVISSGQGFGETALLTCSVRTCSVHAQTDALLYELTKKDFGAILLHEAAFKHMLCRKAEDHTQYNRIKTMQPFALLEPDKMYILMHRMTERTYGLGEDIVVEGERGDFYYIVKSGRVAVLKQKGEPEQRQVAMLTEGDGFGEEALIRDDPRNATCRALEETTVFALDKADFNQIVKASFLDYIYAEDIDLESYRRKYVIIDARILPEYEEEHIEGALSIPVEVLRSKCAALDPGTDYITYCTNDSRGMVAAFLLRNHGLKARCLRGGMGSWTGPLVRGCDGVYRPDA